MDKRKKHNLLLTLAIVILVAGMAVQLYLMVKSGEQAESTGMPDTENQQAR
jgi:flagellar basal body-associated protein FliL